MLFAVHCLDKANSLSIRMENRPAHLAYATSNPAITFGGPLLMDDGETLCGSLLVIEVENRAEVDAILANDPYVQAGLFETVTIHGFKHVLPKKD